MADKIKELIGGPIMGNALIKKKGVQSLDDDVLGTLIRQELGLERETSLIDKKITAASDPKTYFDGRKARQKELSEEIAKFIKNFTEKLGEAGFTVDETGLVARHIANELGNIMRITLEAEYPMEFVRKGLEDLLKKKYR